jgi:opacity protein-like surface antigen
MIRRLSFAALLIVLAAASGSAQDWNITGAGARAEGLSGAFIGVADDATAIVWNPAGLGQLARTEVSAVARYISEESEFKSMLQSDPFTVSNSQSHFNFNFASLAVPFAAGNTNIVLAVAYQSQLDFYSESTDRNRIVTESEGAASTITPGIAFRFGSVVMLGVATNFWLGSFDYSSKFTDGTPISYSPTFSGFNLNLGALLDFGGLSTPFPLKVGLSVKTPFTVEADVDYEFGALSGKGDAEVEMPLMIGVGASYQIGQNLTVAFDYESRQYGGKTVTADIPNFTPSSPMSESDEDLNQIRVGAEYLIVAKGGVIPLRAGFHTVPTVYANFEWNTDSLQYYPTTHVSGKGFSVGTGFISTSFALDFAYSRDIYDEQKWTDPSLGLTDFTSNYSADRYSLSLIVYF